MKQQGPAQSIGLLAFGLCLAVSALAQQSLELQPVPDPAYAQSIRYENQQDFAKGPAKDKDNNIWVYTAAFAETFGMPKSGIDALIGAEAVAFRLEDPGYKTCGMGGKADNCMKNTRYMMDVYIDERKHPLPWADPTQMADWLGEYNSSQWLRIGTSPLNERSGRISTSPAAAGTLGVFQGVKTLRPYANPETQREVFWADNSLIDKNLLGDDAFQYVVVFGYKRNVIDGLSLISFSTYPTVSGGNRELRLRLVERERVMSRTLRQFHEIIIPSRFIEARAQAVKQQQELDQQSYRSLFRPPLGTNPNPNPNPVPSPSK
jgi:hypothetical protein